MTQYNGLYKFRRVLSVILTMAVLLMMTPIWGSTADAAETTHDHDNSGWIEWTSSNTLPTNSGNYYLTNNVTYTTNMWIDINSGNTVNICLNGNNITFTQNAGYYRVNNGAELNIYDCSDICGTITCKNPIRTSGNMTLYNGNIVCESGSGLLINEGGDLTIKGGHISGSDRGVFANKDTNITMTGGTVEGNVGITSHSMHISGGTVIGNTTGISGFDQLTVSGDAKISAVENAIGFSNDGTLIIEGGTIESSNDRYNTIAISTRCYVEISGGVIKGGYCINTMSDIVLSGTPTIETASASFDLSTANSANPKLIITEKLDSNVCYSVRTDCLYDRGFYVFTDSSDTNFNVLANFEPSSELETYNGGYIIIKKSNGQLALAQNIYTVKYDGGKHGEGEIEAASEPTGTNAALSSEKFTRTGYIQTGWATEDGGEKVYGFGDTYSDDTDITLYPVWTKCGHDSEDPKWTDDNNDNGTHSRICDDCGATVTKPHSYDKGEVTRPATETEEGEMTYTCEECGATKTDDIPATGGSTGDGSEDDNPGGNNDDNNDPGNVNVDSKSGANAPSVSIDKETSDKLKAEIIANHLTEEEKAALENGDDLNVILKVDNADNTVSAEDKQAAKAVLTNTGYTVGQYLNIGLIKLINGQQVDKITALNTPIKVAVEIPKALKRNGRTYAVVRIHNGVPEILEDMDNDPNTITIMTDKFSTYTIVYKNAVVDDDDDNDDDSDTNSSETNNHVTNSSNTKNPNTGSTVPGVAVMVFACATGAAAVIKKRRTK